MPAQGGGSRQLGRPPQHAIRYGRGARACWARVSGTHTGEAGSGSAGTSIAKGLSEVWSPGRSRVVKTRCGSRLPVSTAVEKATRASIGFQARGRPTPTLEAVRSVQGREVEGKGPLDSKPEVCPPILLQRINGGPWEKQRVMTQLGYVRADYTSRHSHRCFRILSCVAICHIQSFQPLAFRG